MGGQYRLLHIPQGTAPGQGFFFKYIQHRAGQLPALQRLRQRLLICHLSASHIYKHSAGFDLC